MTEDPSMIHPQSGKPYKFYVNPHGGMHGQEISIPKGRAGFVTLVKPSKKFNKFQLSFLYRKDDKETLAKIKGGLQHMCLAMMKEHFGAKTVEKSKLFKRNVILDGDSEIGISKDGKPHDGYPGCFVINTAHPAESNSGIRYVNCNASDIKGGMIIDGVVVPYLNDDGFSYKLTVVRFVKDDGVRYGYLGGESLLDQVELEVGDADDQASLGSVAAGIL